MKESFILKDFVEGLEMTLLCEEDAVLLEGMVGTSDPGDGIIDVENGLLCNCDSKC